MDQGLDGICEVEEGAAWAKKLFSADMMSALPLVSQNRHVNHFNLTEAVTFMKTFISQVRYLVTKSVDNHEDLYMLIKHLMAQSPSPLARIIIEK